MPNGKERRNEGGGEDNNTKKEEKSDGLTIVGPDSGSSVEDMLREVRFAIPDEVGRGELVEGEEDPEQDFTVEDYLRFVTQNTAEINKQLKEHNMLLRRFLKYYRKAHGLLGPENQTVQGTDKGTD